MSAKGAHFFHLAWQGGWLKPLLSVGYGTVYEFQSLSCKTIVTFIFLYSISC